MFECQFCHLSPGQHRDMLIYLSEPQFYHLSSGEKSTYSKETLWGVERLYEYCLMQCLTSRLYSTNGCHHSSFLSTNSAFCFQGVQNTIWNTLGNRPKLRAIMCLPTLDFFCPGMTWGRYASPTIYSKRPFHPNTSSTTFLYVATMPNCFKSPSVLSLMLCI